MIVVTGAAGFIGSCVLAALEERGHDLVAVDWLRADDRWRNLAGRRLEGIVEPFELLPYVEASAGSIDAVVHMGAISTTTETDIDRLVKQNVGYTQDLWTWCARHHVPFIYASSAATYGDGANGFDDDPSPAALARLRPLNAYGWSKHIVDRWIINNLQTGRPRPPQWAGLKFFNVFGPNEYHKGDMRSVIVKMFETVRAGETPCLFKSYKNDYPHGGQRRDFVYVRDCVDVIVWLLDNPGVSGLYNVGTGQSRTFLDLLDALGKSLRRELPHKFIEMPETLRDRYQYFTEARMERLRAVGYLQPFRSLEDAVEDYVQGFLMTETVYV